MSAGGAGVDGFGGGAAVVVDGAEAGGLIGYFGEEGAHGGEVGGDDADGDFGGGPEAGADVGDCMG